MEEVKQEFVFIKMDHKGDVMIIHPHSELGQLLEIEKNKKLGD